MPRVIDLKFGTMCLVSRSCITELGRINPWRGTPLSRERSNLNQWARSFPSLKSVDYIIAIDGPHRLGELSFLGEIELNQIEESLAPTGIRVSHHKTESLLDRRKVVTSKKRLTSRRPRRAYSGVRRSFCYGHRQHQSCGIPGTNVTNVDLRTGDQTVLQPLSRPSIIQERWGRASMHCEEAERLTRLIGRQYSPRHPALKRQYIR